MLTYDFDRKDNESLYEHLYKCLKADIEGGHLKSGEKLPSKRTLAQNLGISTITVENAYDQLISEGYVYSLPKKGYYVSDISGGYENHRFYVNAEGSIKEPGHPPADMPDVTFTKMPEPNNKECSNLSANEISPENFPFTSWKKLLREVLSSDKEKLMTRSPSSGVSELREAIAEHLLSFRGMKIGPEQIIVGAGTEYLYGVLVQLLGRDKVYCVENPGYKKVPMIYTSLGVRCEYADMDEGGVTVSSLLERGAQIAHISPTHHFPTGITMPVGRRYELLAWANEKEDRYIIEDDYDSEFRLTGKPIPAMQSIDISGKVIYVNTFSMSLSPTIRISYMVLPPELADQFCSRLSFYACTVSNFEQYTLAEFIKRGYFERHINRMRRYYKGRRAKVLECIKQSPLKDRCEIIERDSGLHFIVNISTDIPDEVLKGKLEQKGIRFTPVSEYCSVPVIEAEHKFILNYSNIDIDKLPAALETISEVLG